MGQTHFIYAVEPAYGTWQTPDKWVPVESADLGGEREVDQGRLTGSGRMPFLHVLGAKPAGGTVLMPWWNQRIGSILKTFFTDTATTEVTAPIYDHAFVPDDFAGFKSLSIQQLFNASLGSSLGFNMLSAVVNTCTITAAVKSRVNLEFGFEAKDYVKAGGNWTYNPSVTSPATLWPPVYPLLNRYMMFYDCQVIIGGEATYSGTTKKFTVAGGTKYAKVSSIAIAINNNVDVDGYGLNQPDPTRQAICPGNRDIQVTLDISWCDYSTVLYDAAHAGIPMCLQFDMIGPSVLGNFYEGHVTIPHLFFNPNRLPPISGDESRKTIQLVGAAERDPDTSRDIGMWIRSEEATV